MQKLKVAERFFGFDRNYTITDERDQMIAYANRFVFSWRKKISLYTPDDEHIYDVMHEPFSWGRTFTLEDEHGPLFYIKKEWGIKSKLHVESEISDDQYLIQGNIWSSEYSFYKNGEEFAFVTKKMWSLTGKYGIGILSDEDTHLVIALVLIIDLIIKRRRRS